MTYRYPADLTATDNTDYIKFDFFKYEPPFRRGGSSSLGAYNSGSSDGIDGNFGAQDGPGCILYMPQDVSTSYAASWGGKEVSNFGAGALSGYANVTNGDAGGLLDNAAAGVSGLSRLPTTFSAALVKMGLNVMQTNLTINDILGGTQGVILNPNVELFFGGPQIRNIGFAFKMFAKNSSDALNMMKICNLFKYHSCASFGGSPSADSGVADWLNQVGQAAATAASSGLTGNLPTQTPAQASGASGYSGGYITIPSLVRMQLMQGGNKHPHLSQYKSLAITNVDINYTPDGSYSTMIDGYPSAVELRVSFVETKIVYKQDLLKSTAWSY